MSSAARPTKVLTIVEENHGVRQARAGMPFLAQLATAYGQADHYRSLTHPSLPNYLAMAGGSTFGVSDDAGPSSHRIAGRSVFDAALAAHRTAKTYAEGMTSPCQRSSAGRYAVKHNPWAYFADPASRAGCLANDVPASDLKSDVAGGSLPTVGLLVPDLCHDAHDCSLGTADDWLRNQVGLLMSGPDWKSGRLAIVVTFDEVEGGSSGNLLTVVAWPGLSHRHVSAALSHYSWTRWMTDLVGAAPLRPATSLGTAFGL